MSFSVGHNMQNSAASISGRGSPAPPTGVGESFNKDRSLQLQKLGEMDQKEFHDCRTVIAKTVDDACLASIRNFQASGQYDEAEKVLEQVIAAAELEGGRYKEAQACSRTAELLNKWASALPSYGLETMERAARYGSRAVRLFEESLAA
eukprot:CAMPEP_0172181840 /NCGR_PEP_ID=MMETSP1050-20130122/18054_1 /TAXON_ID=233186 /ORGANISM="Cryptomonas curvata, Strain CCAP979/52" /LENGTH=148 /DNA_ID=CAMNT_0012855193 /DNA_START=155 /DNA_END=597 /DNA_ORIENTATION=-